MFKEELEEYAYLTDFEGRNSCIPTTVSPYPKKLRRIQTVATSDECGWKSYVVKTKKGLYGIALESFIFTSAQAADPDINIPQAYLNEEVRKDAERIAEAFPKYDVALSYDKDNDPTIVILLTEDKVKLITQDQLLKIAMKACSLSRYSVSDIVNRYQYEFAV